ncbi:peptidylprolyl isomerase [Sodalis-like secondary symbiont of Drepanosiphum platanoidis]|uniref:peptidylprolyl isomerase n=1 Tax=Sodalis-like secondary symbiont of Drepanosiphum platanoidis TaxID=2994493 RepID=UPI0034642148
MKSLKIIFLLLILYSQNIFSQEKILNKIVAIVNNNIILKSDVYLTYFLMKLNKNKYIKKKIINKSYIYKKIINKLIIDTLILEQSFKKKIFINKKEINYFLKKFIKNNNFTKNTLKKYLINLNINYKDFIEKIKKEILIFKLKNKEILNRINILPEEIKTLTNNIINKKKINEYKISHILIPLKETDNSYKINKLKILSNLFFIESKKNIKFKKLINIFSTKKRKIILEKIGWINYNDLPKIFHYYLKNTKKNTIIGPIRSNAGFHILKIHDIYCNNEKKIVTKINLYHMSFNFHSNFFCKNKYFNSLKLIQKIKNNDLLYNNFIFKKKKIINNNLNKKNNKNIINYNFLKKIINLKQGEISPFFYLNKKWNCIKILNINEIYNTKKIDQISYNKLLNYKFKIELKKWINEIKSNAYIKIIYNKF